ncbi:MAG: ester cyclase [Saprospiraceae bacterium]|nr:ester cyclase [Lewinellaceae bacterium]
MKTLKIFTVLFLFSLFGTTLCAQDAAQNKAACLKVYECINNQDFDCMAELMADDMIEYAAPEPVQGKDNVLQGIREYFEAFDMQVVPDKMVAEGNTVMILVTATGTWKKDFMGMKATGKSFRIQDVDILEFDDAGKVKAHWSVQDPMVMMSQIAN